ncbi:hypothetical protein FGB62_118g013 [Gracilaria domingensis]|nr:hypothetical protein FGB62_118g013 [Gracilaria domingensis]
MDITFAQIAASGERLALVSYAFSESETSVQSSADQSASDEVVLVPNKIIPTHFKRFSINIKRAPELDSVTRLTRHSLEDVPRLAEESNGTSEDSSGQLSKNCADGGALSKEVLRKRKYRAINKNRERENKKRRDRYMKRKLPFTSDLVQKFDPLPDAKVRGGFIPYERNIRLPIRVARNDCDGELRIIQVLRRYEIETWYHQWIPNVNSQPSCAGPLYAIQSIMGKRSVIHIQNEQ